MMKPGLLIAGRLPPARMIEVARTAEGAGFGTLWMADERFYREVYEYLTMLALSTQRIGLGTCVTDPYSRHPAMTAVAIATLDEISGGRALLGIGAGLSGFVEMGVDRRKPVVAMREAIELIRLLLKGGKVDYSGEIISFHDGHLDFAPLRVDIPVWIASNGPLGQILAGRVAQGAIMEACGSVEEARVFIKRVREAAAKAGRTPQDVQCVARLNFCVAENGKAARDTMRARVGRNLVGGHMSFTTIDKEAITLPPEAVAKVEGVPYKAGLQPYEALAPYVTDQMVDLMTLAGTADEIVAHAVALCRSGIDGLIISPNPTPAEAIDSQIRIFGERIWPAIEQELAR